jgi:4-oxalocrotonate tautomerase
MPVITVQMYEGRTIEQKRALVAALTKAAMDTIGAKAEATDVIIHDVAKHDWGIAGKLASDTSGA